MVFAVVYGLLGSAHSCFCPFGGAFALKPRQRVTLFDRICRRCVVGDPQFARFAGWIRESSSFALIIPVCGVISDVSSVASLFKCV